MQPIDRTGARARWAQALIVAVLLHQPAQAQDNVRASRQLSATSDVIRSPAKIKLLRDRIIRNPAIVVQPVQPAPDGPVEAPAVQPAPETAPVATTTPLKLGDTRFIKLGIEDEKSAGDLVKQAIPDTLRGQAAVFQGVVQTTDTQSQELILKAVAFPRAPLRLNHETGKFEGGVSVGVIEVGGGAVRTLSAPIAFQVIGPVTSEPDTVTATQTAPPYREIRVQTDSPDSEVQITVVSNVAPSGETLTLKVRPSLAITVTPSSIQGWGLETADVLVSAQGFETAKNNRLQLSTTLGRLSANQAALDQGGMAQVSVRSESVGSGTISVSGAGLDGSSTTIGYIFPWRFLGAALIGGVVGGLLRKRSRSSSPTALFKSLGIAVLSAAVVVALYVLGINLVGFALPNHGGEVLVFVVAALGALYGTKLLSANPVTKA